MDGPTRQAYLRGDPVPAGIRPFGEPSFPEIRSQAEAIARGVFAQLGLPDPFELQDTNGKLPPIDWEVAKFHGHDFIAEKMNSSYRTVAALLCPDEDHSPLWYASTIATALARYDLVKLRAGSASVDWGWEIEMAAMHGAHLGGLMANCNLKFIHEKDALPGKKTVQAASQAGQARARAEAERLDEPMREMAERVSKGEPKLSAARHIVNKWKLDTKPTSFVRNYDRKQEK